MTDETSARRSRKAWAWLRAMLSDRLIFVILFGSIILVNWTAALWIVHHTWQQREAAAFQMVNDEAQSSARNIDDRFKDADRILLELRNRHPRGNQDLEAGLWIEGESGGIALIARDGRVVAASPGANTLGWPRLMARLATSGDVLEIGEPTSGKNGDFSYVPVARRIVEPDGSFGGILMYSLGSRELSRLSPSIRMLDGSVTLITDDGLILARTPEVRGTVGIRMIHTADLSPIGETSGGEVLKSETPRGEIPGGKTSGDETSGVRHHVSTIDGIDRFLAWRRLPGVPVRLVVGVGHDAIFAEWEMLRFAVVVTRLLSTGLIILTGFFWYSRRRRAKISGNALSAILTSIEHGIRVESRDGNVVAANQAGAALPMPACMSPRAEIHRPDGSIIQIARHDLDDGGTVLVGTDVTARHAAEARIAFLSDHDRLTGLPNRWRAVSRIQELIAERAESTRAAALILLDLDGFQDINDTLGHEGGDLILTEVAFRLRDFLSGRDIVARLGGDEFLLFLNDPDNEAAIMGLARQLPLTLARPIAARGQQVRLGASMGIAIYPRDGADVATLFQHADIALSAAKMAGRGTARSFEPSMMISFEEHRMMESDLRRALDGDELELCLQPQFSCETLDVTGFEALMRWRHPTRGMLSPTVFIPIAERSGLINPLGLWAIEHACIAAAGWRNRHRVAVNLSPSQLRCETIQEDIRGILRRTQFPAHLLELEVTESVLLDEDQRTLETLYKLRAMDIRVTLDDFGAGYSSLSYLRRFPFDKIKIDKSFVQGQGTDRGTRVILEAMIRMCNDLGFDVVAEGVETESQLNELRQLGCREIQGFLLGEPLLPHMVEDFLGVHGRRSGFGRIQNIASTPS